MKRTAATIALLMILSACASGPTTAERLTAVELTEAWPCGYGFALSDVDQSVAVKVYATSTDEPPGSPGSLPHPDWEAVVEVGSDLMANHCDDVYEEGEPIPDVGQRLTISAASFTYPNDVAAAGCPSLVTADLTGVTATADAGEVELGDLRIANDAFGCFAG